MSARVGLVGYACATGLGIAARDFFTHLPFARWLVVEHHRHGVETAWLDERCTLWSPSDGLSAVDAWLGRVDVVFSIERSYIGCLWLVAKHHDVRVVVMPNAEWFDPAARGLSLVDTFIAPTEVCCTYLRQLGLGDRTVYIPHAIDTGQFAFTPRTRASTFVHCRGWGGVQQRKGTDLVLAAARRCPKVPFTIRHQHWDDTPVPPNVTLIGASSEPRELYGTGDVAIQPSRWEGAGLQILEAMSCGLPTIVADGPPMNEYPSTRALCVPATARPIDLGHKPWLAWDMSVDALVDTIQAMHGQPLGELSAAARARMEARSWEQLRPAYASILGMH